MSKVASALDPTEIVSIKRSHDKKGYFAQTRDGRSRRLRSVTAALKIISKDEVLMRWAVGLYSKCIKTMAPVGQVLTPEAVDTMIEAGSNEFERVRYDAAEVGTRAHNIIDAWLKHEPIPRLEDEDPRVQNALKLFWAWWEGKGLRVVESELAVYNAEHGYAGTLDFLCELPNGKLALLDWKTSKGIYSEYYLQVAAYYYALISMPEDKGGRKASDFSEATILRIGKEDAYFEPASIPLEVLPGAYRAFFCCLQLMTGLSDVETVERARWKAYQAHLRSLESPGKDAPF